jgi:CRISPR-associated protein Csx10
MESLKIEFLSDWHIGSGTGRPGDVDRLIRRDQHGLPYLPAKSITGIWRDACEMVAEALDNREAWKAWVNYLFGSQPGIAKPGSSKIQIRPKPAALSLRSAHMPAPMVQALQHKPALQAAMTFVKPGIKIDDRSGYVKKDYLRFEEVARTGLTLTTTFEINGVEKETPEYETAIALLSAGAAFIHRIGGKRRRGMGRCQVEVVRYSASIAADWIENNPPKSVPKIEPLYGQPSLSKGGSIEQGGWHCFDLTITAEQPLILSKRTIGNLVETLDYIPATYLLPIVLKSWQGINVGEVIEQGDFLITNATLLTEGVAGRPAPFVLFEEKQKDEDATTDKFYNRFYASGERQLKQCRQGYLGEELPVQTVDRQVETHNTIDDAVQRPTSDVGGVYTYEAIAPQTQLMAQVRIRDRLFHQLNSDWQSNLTRKSQQIGRTKKDEYGQISITLSEVSATSSAHKPNTRLTVWLLSDVLLRDEWLQPTNRIDVLISDLATALDVSLKQSDSPNSLFARQRRTESWQTRWGLPRPSLIGLSAGSCLLLEVEGDLKPELCRKVELTGIGERCVEGYGQILLNSPLLDRSVIDVLKPDPNSDSDRTEPEGIPIPHDAGEILQYAHLIEKAAWREAIRQSVQIIAGRKSVREHDFHLTIAEDTGRSKPSLSQLGGLRSQAMQLRQGDDRLRKWLGALKADGKWSNETVDAFIELLKGEAIWTQLDFEKTLKLTYGKLTLSQGGEARLKGELWAEAVQSLIVALTRAHKREVEGLPKELGEKGAKKNG